jgi:hypothetical protein
VNAADAFPTFCHISEYGEAGYQALHRMLAISQPLNLWAPSSAYLRSPVCKIPPKDFVRYVDDGLIRVFGREEWLLDPARRARHPWGERARWDRQVDGALKERCLEDQNEPEEQRRVVVAPPEKGWEWAKRYLEEHPDQVARWHRIFRSKTAHLKVPAGTLQRATRDEQDPFRVAQTILRDARNHGEAFALSQAEVPFLLAPSDQQFLKVLADAPPSDYRQAAISVSSRRVSRDETMADLAAQLLEVLHHLDIRAKNRAEPGSLDKFFRSEDHQLLVAWIAGICERLKRTDARTIDNEIIDELRDNLGRAEFENPLRDLLTHPAATSAGIVDFATTAVDWLVHPEDPLALTGVLASAFLIGTGLFKQLGHVPSSFTGVQWPFLYTYGREAKKRDLPTMRFVLSELTRQ